jgi:hypothetical protein
MQFFQIQHVYEYLWQVSVSNFGKAEICFPNYTMNMKLPPWLIKHCAMKTRGSGGISPPCLASTLDGSESSYSRPCPFTSNERTRGYPLYRRMLGPRAGLNAVEKREMSCPCWESNHGPSNSLLVTISTELSWHLYHEIKKKFSHSLRNAFRKILNGPVSSAKSKCN